MTQSRFNDDATAKAYQDLLLPLVFNPWGRLLMGKAGLKPGDQVLDVATGPGTLARLVSEILGPKSRVVGVDNSPPMLAQAKAMPPVPNGAELSYLEAQAGNLPFPAAQFDAVVCQQGLQFFLDQLGALKEMKRVLKPGGRLALALWSHDRAMTYFVAIHDALDATLAQPPKRAAIGWLDQSRLRDLLARAGFTDQVVSEETLTVALEGGMPQALECAIGTTSGPAIKAMSPGERVRFEGLVSGNLAPWKKGRAIHGPGFGGHCVRLIASKLGSYCRQKGNKY